MVTDDKDNSPTISTQRRGKGLGTGRIQWRTVTKKNGKQYKQAWYDWQIKIGSKTLGKSTYIPKRLLAKVQALEAAKVPVPEVLRVLGVGEKHSPESKSNISTQFLGDKPNADSHQISPRKKRRNQGLGSGSIEWRINKGKYLVSQKLKRMPFLTQIINLYLLIASKKFVESSVNRIFKLRRAPDFHLPVSENNMRFQELRSLLHC